MARRITVGGWPKNMALQLVFNWNLWKKSKKQKLFLSPHDPPVDRVNFNFVVNHPFKIESKEN